MTILAGRKSGLSGWFAESSFARIRDQRTAATERCASQIGTCNSANLDPQFAISTVANHSPGIDLFVCLFVRYRSFYPIYLCERAHYMREREG